MWEFTGYTFDFSLSGNDSDSDTKPITISKDFWLCQIALIATGDFKITIHNTGDRRDVISGVKASSLVHSVTTPTPYNLPLLKRGYPKEEGTEIVGMEVFRGGSSIEVSVTDISGSSNTIQLTLLGYHVDKGSAVLNYEGTKY